jgi:hypothetical protein
MNGIPQSTTSWTAEDEFLVGAEIFILAIIFIPFLGPQSNGYSGKVTAA